MNGREKIFVSYSHKDRKLFEEFKTMMAPAIQKGVVDLWDDEKIPPGAPWEQEIQKALASAKVAVLLVSQNFLASHFITKQELPPLLTAAKKEGVTIFWIYLSAALVEETEIISYQAAHDVSKPLNKLTVAKRQEVLSGACKKLIAVAAMKTASAVAAAGAPQPEQRAVMRDPQRAPSTVELLHTIPGHQSWINRIAWSPDGHRLATACNDGRVRLIDPESGQVSFEFHAHDTVAASVAWSPDGKRLATGGYDKALRVWDAGTGKPLYRAAYQSGVHSVAWSPDGGILFSGWGSGNIRLYDSLSGELLRRFQGHRTNVFSVSWAEPLWLATGGGDGLVRTWQRLSDKPRDLAGHKGPVLCTAIGRNGTLVSGGADGTIRIWDFASGNTARELTAHGKPVRSLSFSHDGRLLASKAADGRVLIWRVDTWEIVAAFDEPASEAWLSGIAFHPSELLLASLGEGDTVVRLWRLSL